MVVLQQVFLSAWDILFFLLLVVEVFILFLLTVSYNYLTSSSKEQPIIVPLFFPTQLAEKELQKINTFKAPREKLLCIMNCCRVINNLLLNASMSENHALAGLDDFLPVLIYVTIKASSPW